MQAFVIFNFLLISIVGLLPQGIGIGMVQGQPGGNITQRDEGESLLSPLAQAPSNPLNKLNPPLQPNANTTDLVSLMKTFVDNSQATKLRENMMNYFG